MQPKILSLALVCLLARISLGQEDTRINVFAPEKLVDDAKESHLSTVAGKKDFTIRFLGGSRKEIGVRPIRYEDKIGSENFVLEFSWRTNNPNDSFGPDISIGQMGGWRGGPFIDFDCNGVRLVLSALDPKSQIYNYAITDDDGKQVQVSPKYTYFYGKTNKARNEFNHTKIVVNKQTVTVFQNQILTYSCSLEDQRTFLKTQRKAHIGPNKPGSPNYQSIFFGKVIEELISANKQASLYLSFQEDHHYSDCEMCAVEFKDFSIRFEEEKLDLTQFHKSRSPRELILQDLFLQNLFAKEPAGLPKNTKQMLLLAPFKGPANIRTPAYCANGAIFFPERMGLELPEEPFLFNPKKGFEQEFEFPPVWVNHWYNNGSIYLYAFEEGLVWNRNKWDKYFDLFVTFKPSEYQMIRGAKKKMNLVVLVEDSVPPEVAEYFEEKIKAWEKK